MIESDFRIFETVGALVVVLDEDDRIVFWNQPCSDLTGYSLAEVDGRQFWEFLLPPEEIEAVKAALGTKRTGPRPIRVASHWITKAGDRRWIAWSHTMATGPYGYPRYFIKTGMDETERKQAEERLAGEMTYRATLATENARLLAEAQRFTHDQREANQQMVRATIQAQELMGDAEVARATAAQSELELRQVAEFRERFIGILGHDLRNPLSAISMTAAMLLRSGHLDDQDERKVARIINSSQRMTRMISQLLDLTRARLGGGFPLELKHTDLRDVCKSVAEEFGVPIELHFEGDVTGTWDPDRLAEALSNIAGNAIEHATPGTEIIFMAHANEAEVVVEIINQGDPIPAELVPFIFEPFRRAAPQVKSPTGNLGLGLFIAKQIVISGGGTIDAHSADGTTRFVIHLPREGSSVPAAWPP